MSKPLFTSGTKQREVQECPSQEFGEQGPDSHVVGSVLCTSARGNDRASTRASQ